MADAEKTRVLVLFGGRSAEHEISILSARFIVQSMDRSRYEPVLVGITPAGRWHLQDEAALQALAADARTVRVDPQQPPALLAPIPRPHDSGAPGTLLVEGGEAQGVDIAFPVLHGPLGEDGCIQGLFELAGLPYVGSGVLGCALGMDKTLQRRVLQEAELPVVRSVTLQQQAPSADPSFDELLEDCEALGYPLFVKPANMGSSLGVGRARDRAELDKAVATAFSFDTKVVVEKGLEQPREIELAVLGNEDPRASVPGEIVVHHADGFYSYDAKYLDPDGAELCIPAALHRQESSAVQLLALRAFSALGCAGMARVDLFLTAERDVYINEINTIPGFTAISMYPQLWAASGVGATELVTELCELGRQRHAARAELRTTRE